MAEFRINQLRLSVEEINRIDAGKLNLLTTRVAQHIASKTSEKPFTDVELQKLESSLEIEREKVDTLIEGIQDLFYEAAYHKMTPNKLETQLTGLGIGDEKVKVLVAVWGKAMQLIVDSLLKKSVLPRVSHLAYNLAVEAGSDKATSEKNIRAHLQIGLNSEGLTDSTETLDVELSHEELYNLHSQLARIQAQLDAIAEK